MMKKSIRFGIFLVGMHKKLFHRTKIDALFAITILFVNPFSGFAQTYTEIRLGNQIWMKDNLDLTKFRNGDPIDEVISKSDWIRYTKEKKPAWCFWNNDPETSKTCGILYNKFAVEDPRGLAPTGWHIPLKREVEELDSIIQKFEVSLPINICGNRHLEIDSVIGNNRYYTQCSFFLPSFSSANFWIADPIFDKENPYGSYFSLSSKYESLSINFWDSGCGYYVRCIKD
jgi:uncharacterized protein (TIGR02145 family)